MMSDLAYFGNLRNMITPISRKKKYCIRMKFYLFVFAFIFGCGDKKGDEETDKMSEGTAIKLARKHGDISVEKPYAPKMIHLEKGQQTSSLDESLKAVYERLSIASSDPGRYQFVFIERETIQHRKKKLSDMLSERKTSGTYPKKALHLMLGGKASYKVDTYPWIVATDGENHLFLIEIAFANSGSEKDVVDEYLSDQLEADATWETPDNGKADNDPDREGPYRTAAADNPSVAMLLDWLKEFRTRRLLGIRWVEMFENTPEPFCTKTKYLTLIKI
jgi:hypothetical protein